MDTREAAARLLGFASSALATPESSALISELIASVSGRHKLRFVAYILHNEGFNKIVFQLYCFLCDGNITSHSRVG